MNTEYTPTASFLSTFYFQKPKNLGRIPSILMLSWQVGVIEQSDRYTIVSVSGH